MLLRIALLLEMLAVVVCIHCIYGKKLTCNIITMVFVLLVLIILDVINEWELGGAASFMVYLLFFAYCLAEFKESVRNTIFKVGIFLVVFSAIQFISMLFVRLWIDRNEAVQTVIGNFFVLLVCLCWLPGWKLNGLIKGMRSGDRLFRTAILFAVMVSASMLLQGKLHKGIHIEMFIFAVPAAVLLCILAMKWSGLKSTVEKLEYEDRLNEVMQRNYTDLLTRVRLQQHALKNHLAALFSMHYSYHTYEQLVQAQKEYSGRVQYENRFNSLLGLENGFLCGFLYGKLQELEEKGMTIEYKIGTALKEYPLSVYHLIEMLGILLDNAAEALCESQEKKIWFLVEEDEEAYQFTVCNPYPYVSYAEIEAWFQLGVSEKGRERGIGLYHLKELCREGESSIVCRNVEIEHTNWIAFILRIAKEGHRIV